jgi:hypothetical protein
MNEHKTASFVAKAAWVAFLALAVAQACGLALARNRMWAFLLVGVVAVVASSICAPPVKRL